MQTISQPAFFKLSHDDRKSALEALIFSSEEPLSSKQIINMLVNVEFSVPNNYASEDSNADETANLAEIYIPDESELNENYFDKIISEINSDIALSARPFRIVKVGGGWQFGLLPDFGQLIHKHFKTKVKKRLSQAALETLAIIAYKQPVSKPEIEQIRGVNSNEVVNSLIEKNFVKIAGRSESLGKPLLYSTTGEFLRVFGINSLDDLPKLKELEEIAPQTLYEYNLEPEVKILDEEFQKDDYSELNSDDDIDSLSDDELEVNEDLVETKPEFID